MRNSNQKNSLSSLFFVIAFSFAFFACQSIHASDTQAFFLDAFRLTQKLSEVGEYGASIEFDSATVDARLKLVIPGMPGAAKARDLHDAHIDSYACRIEAIPRLTLHVGALTVSGLAARAKTPLFSIISPFHEPTAPLSGSTFGLGTAKKTDGGAIEFRSSGARLAACTAKLENPKDSAWVLAEKEFRSFSEENHYLVLSLFSGIKRVEEKTETSWFVNDPLEPETSILMPGAECLFRKGSFGGSITGFGNFATARKLAGLIRSELFIDSGSFLLSGGVARTDRYFLDFDGASSRILSRVFLAPQYGFADRWTIGAIISKDIERGEKYYYENGTVYSGGCGIKFEKAGTRIRVQAMRKERTNTLSASIYRIGLGLQYLTASILSSCEIPGSDICLPDKIAISGKLGIAPFRNRENGVAASIGYKGIFEPKTDDTAGNASHKGSLGIEGFFSTRHAFWRCVLQSAIATDGSQPEGSIMLELQIH